MASPNVHDARPMAVDQASSRQPPRPFSTPPQIHPQTAQHMRTTPQRRQQPRRSHTSMGRRPEPEVQMQPLFGPPLTFPLDPLER